MQANCQESNILSNYLNLFMVFKRQLKCAPLVTFGKDVVAIFVITRSENSATN